MTRFQALVRLKEEVHELMGALSVREIVLNPPLIRQIEAVLAVLSKVM